MIKVLTTLQKIKALKMLLSDDIELRAIAIEILTMKYLNTFIHIDDFKNLYLNLLQDNKFSFNFTKLYIKTTIMDEIKRLET